MLYIVSFRDKLLKISSKHYLGAKDNEHLMELIKIRYPSNRFDMKKYEVIIDNNDSQVYDK